MKKKLMSLFMLVFIVNVASAYISPQALERVEKQGLISSRVDCQPAQEQTVMEVNNVRARLLVGGDLWWDKTNGSYIVPKPEDGGVAVSSLYTGGVWIGGYDPNGNLKLAAVDFAQGNITDWYAGPLDENGDSDLEICNQWDEFFKVNGDEVRKHVAYINSTENPSCDSIADNVKYWPARGNPYFSEKYGFVLPDQNLAPFYDNNIPPDGRYNPCDGDFPIVDIRGCEPAEGDIEAALKLLPDEMVYWIYNDNGGPHRATRATAIQMEVRVQAFAYATNDEINDMTFYRYKLVNKASDAIGDCYFAMFVDADLGCGRDDYIGCDTTKVRRINPATGEEEFRSRDLMYVYNEDAVDGIEGGTSCDGVETYRRNIPIVGIDYFRGPRRPYRFEKNDNGEVVLDEDGNKVLNVLTLEDEDLTTIDTLLELGMTSFTYFNNPGIGNPDPNTTDPDLGQEFYNYMTGTWKDGTPYTDGGTGLNPGSTDTTSYAFPAFPDQNGWNMCNENLPFGDRRTVQATGPLLLTPDATNELIVGAVWVPDFDYPCPDLSRFIAADEKAQNLFDACFEIINGPDAPDMYSIELDRQLVLILGNDPSILESNNANEEYEEIDINAPPGVEDNKYVFEGYQIFQLENANVSIQELDDISKARLVKQVDLDNGINEIINWSRLANPLGGSDLWIPQTEVSGEDAGLAHSFTITRDQFKDEDLINHKNYYFTVLAYAYNNYGTFDVDNPEITQQTPFLQGRRNIRTYTFTPRPIVYSDLNSAYGLEAEITRLSGQGTGDNFLDLKEEMYDLIISNGSVSEVQYERGNAPITVKVVDPIRVVNGDYRLEIVGEYNDSKRNPSLEEGANWVLTDLSNNDVIASERTIDRLNEQIIPRTGFSVTIKQVNEPGTTPNGESGYIGESVEYSNLDGGSWLNMIDPTSGFVVNDNNAATPDPQVFGYTVIGSTQDPNSTFVGELNLFSPMYLTRSNQVTENGVSRFNYGPGWQELQQISVNNQGLLPKNLNNVDIVFTSDKSKWSRCPVVETASVNYTSATILGESTIGGANQFDLRKSNSVDKNGNDDGTGQGMGWFPGYAVDVETGNRLNIFFGENSVFRDEVDEELSPVPGTANNGDDMIFNPNGNVFPGGINSLFDANEAFATYGGGQHFIYVTRMLYDEGAALAEGFNRAGPQKAAAIGQITWAGWPLANNLLSIDEGLIPNDVKVKLRVKNPYNKELQSEEPLDGLDFVTVGDLPVYNISFDNVSMQTVEPSRNEDALANVQVVPNPYYAYSSYENTQFDKTIKVTNLPARATVTIYSLDGKFIRQFRRNEVGRVPNDSDDPLFGSNQIVPSLEWDLNNSKGIPVASGVYIFHIEAPELNAERSVKWFGVNRRFDPSGL